MSNTSGKSLSSKPLATLSGLSYTDLQIIEAVFFQRKYSEENEKTLENIRAAKLRLRKRIIALRTLAA